MKRFGAWGAIAACSAAVYAQVIVNPRSGHPVFVCPGEVFSVEVSLSSPCAGWSCALANGDLTRSLEVLDVHWGTATIRNGRSDGYTVRVRAPVNLPPELYSLTVSCSQGTYTEHRAVAVASTLQESFSIVHVTDPHTGPAVNDATFRQLLRVVDRIGARFIAVTGDVCAYPATDATASAAAALLNTCQTPTLVGIGNHDSPRMGYAGSAAAHAAWERSLGQAYFAVRMGAVCAVMHDITDPALLDPGTGWIAAVLSRWRTDAATGFRILLQHATAYWHACVPLIEQRPDLMLAGHLHGNYLTQLQPYPILVTADAAAGYFRLVRIHRHANGTWSLGSYAYPGTIAGSIRAFDAAGLPILDVIHAAALDGTAVEDTVTIVNRCDERFENVRIRCALRRGEYAVQGATVLAQYPADDGNRTVVLCRASVDPRATATVRVTPASVNERTLRIRIHPNPARPGDARVTISVQTHQAAPITVAVFTLDGRPVTRMVRTNASAGDHEFHWDLRAADGRPVASGAYLVRATAAGGSGWARCGVVR